MIAFQIFVTYLVLSLFAGLTLMTVDAASGFKIRRIEGLVTFLVIPPLMVILAGGVSVLLFKLWAQ